jgi:hypothetical protein
VAHFFPSRPIEIEIAIEVEVEVDFDVDPDVMDRCRFQVLEDL